MIRLKLPYLSFPVISKKGVTYFNGEVGNVDAYTVVVQFTGDVSASNYKTGVTIKVNGALWAIDDATRQSNHAVVYFVVHAVTVGQTVTWEYDSGSGNYADLDTISAQTVANNVFTASMAGYYMGCLGLTYSS
jgi:hypothetical protein